MVLSRQAMKPTAEPKAKIDEAAAAIISAPAMETQGREAGRQDRQPPDSRPRS